MAPQQFPEQTAAEQASTIDTILDAAHLLNDYLTVRSQYGSTDPTPDFPALGKSHKLFRARPTYTRSIG